MKNKMIFNNEINEKSLRGIHGDPAISQALVRIGNILDRQADYVEILNERIEALEAKAIQPNIVVKKNNDNDDLRRAIMDADNALQRVIYHFRKSVENN